MLGKRTEACPMDSFHAYPDPRPATNPPICAKYATQPGSPITAKITCMINQKGINAMAGILTVVIKKSKYQRLHLLVETL